MKWYIGGVLTAISLALAFTAGGASAQSVLATRGLGFPLDPQEARSRGMGGIGLGLPDPEISWINPAAAVGLPAPGLVFAYQFDEVTADTPSGSTHGTTARFPLLLGAFPAGQRVVLMAGYGGFLDQNWVVEQPDTVVLGRDTISVVDRFSSSGGVARLRLGAGFQVIERVGVGVGLDYYTGAAERVQGRLFPGEVVPTCCRARWTYKGIGYTTGVQWSTPGSSAVAASVTYGGQLDATPREVDGEGKTYDLPTIARLGASGRVGQDVLLALSGSWGGWSALDDALAVDGGARNSWSAHGGVEWDALTIRGRNLPLRIGARTEALPFRWGSATTLDWATERALSAGGGLVMGGGGARTDIAFDFGGRGGQATGIEESFWRLSLSVLVLGR